MKLPTEIHVKWEEGDGEPYLAASDNGLASLMEDDGPAHVGVYRLVKTLRVRKETVSEEIRK